MELVRRSCCSFGVTMLQRWWSQWNVAFLLLPVARGTLERRPPAGRPISQQNPEVRLP